MNPLNKKYAQLIKYFFVLAFFQIANAQQIYTNGPLTTGATSNNGVLATAGYTWSELQNETGNTTESNSLAGAGGIYTADGANSVLNVDDFIVPTGQVWNVNSVEVFVYQTAYMGTTVPPVDEMRVQIYNGDPQFGGTPIAGNLTSNVIDIPNSSDAMLFRIFNTTTPAPGIAIGSVRRIWKVRGTIAASLPSGTYWLVYQLHSTNDDRSFFPLVTIPGIRGLPGWNAKQNVVASNAPGQALGWAAVVDDGIPATAPDFPLDFPFIINGTVTLGVDENVLETGISLSPNPVMDVLSITVPSDSVVKSYEIVDVNGKSVKSFYATTGITEINVFELPIGNYFLKLKSDKGECTKKFIKQ